MRRLSILTLVSLLCWMPASLAAQEAPAGDPAEVAPTGTSPAEAADADPAPETAPAEASPAEAAPVELEEASDEGAGHKLSFTISPFHLILHLLTGCEEGDEGCTNPEPRWEATLPFIEITGEYRVLDKLGVAGLFGIGVFEVPVEETGNRASLTAVEVGVSGRYYVFGDFEHGMQLGAAVDYVYASASVEGITALGEGVVFGGFAGYKVAMDVGFTFEIQLGAQHWVARAATETGQAASSDSDTSVLLNLNLGWSFGF